MPESTVNVTPGAGAKLHTWQRTIGANSVEDEYVLPGEQPLASYTVSFVAVSTANTGDDVVQVMAGASLLVRVRRIYIEQAALVTAAATLVLQCLRITSAGTGGGAITPSKLDNAAAAAGATAAQAVPNATHGTAGVELFRKTLWLVQTQPTGSTDKPEASWEQHPSSQPIIIPAGATNGIALRIVTGRAGASVNGFIEFTETSF